MQVARTCQSQTKDGDRCQAPAVGNSLFCFFHDPDLADDRRRAQAAGGRNGAMKTLPSSTPDARVEGPQDVAALLAETISQVRRGDIDPRVGNAVGYLANILMKAIEQGNLEDRIKSLEGAINHRPTPDLEITRS